MFTKHKQNYTQNRKQKDARTSAGFLKIILLFIIFAGILWYYNIDVRGFIDSHPQIKSFFEWARDFLAAIWNTISDQLDRLTGTKAV